ncbi:hypothetical protein GCM10022377_09970 [Zhihengliuella alba]|uniref:Helix-turn-helix domain-containing protein n=1 Tax=Zhihengliuella alba TaxID=547018 RepID=A0ABP7D028_9MICC
MNATARLMTIDELSEELSIPVATLYWYRHKGSGPRCARIGKRLMYRRGDVDAWLNEAFETGKAS